MTDWCDMQQVLDDLAAADLLRKPAVLSSPVGPTVTVDGRELVCLCSNDYLGLAGDESVKAATIEAIGRWGVGAGASRLVCGTTEAHQALEDRLAEFKRTESAIVTATGWQANRVAIGALAGEGDLILCDKLDHASILDAARGSGAAVRTYAHGDLDRAEQLLTRHRAAHRRCLIVTDSLFSMDGDVAPLPELVELKDRFEARLLIDEAHATGVLGEHGRGAAELAGVEGCVDAVVGTLSKAVGGVGRLRGRADSADRRDSQHRAELHLHHRIAADDLCGRDESAGYRSRRTRAPRQTSGNGHGAARSITRKRL